MERGGGGKQLIRGITDDLGGSQRQLLWDIMYPIFRLLPQPSFLDPQLSDEEIHVFFHLFPSLFSFAARVSISTSIFPGRFECSKSCENLIELFFFFLIELLFSMWGFKAEWNLVDVVQRVDFNSAEHSFCVLGKTWHSLKDNFPQKAESWFS